ALDWTSPVGPVIVAGVPAPRPAWLAIGPCATPGTRPRDHLNLMLPVVAQYFQSTMEVEHAASELAERYEEINLLYTISEILGRTVSLGEAAGTILREVSDTVGARRASILVHDRLTDSLQVVAAIGVDPKAVPPIPVADACSVSARVFNTLHPTIVEDGESPCDAESGYRRGAMLSVPIMWTSPRRPSEPLGVVNLSDRRSGQAFTAGDLKLVAAIATQIGTAIQNARLVQESLTQQQLAHEMQMAHDLQMKLLPVATVVAPEATVAARVVPAESVGGDFYNLFPLGGSRTGVMIGDVSGHGYRAALIMALTMSAAAIHAQATTDPGAMLRALFASVRGELETTEMYLSAFYGVVDRSSGTLCYANAGHPHAFVLGTDGPPERLAAIDPPIGMVPIAAATAERPWRHGDLLILFTDGISDARGPDGERLGEARVLETVQQHRALAPDQILERVFEDLQRHTGDGARRDDLTLVLLRS
ncbi:MAG: SpoIIE family protein phosphatase, partial [Gemmatimonadota bacterium]|nr:SpoIIE family protein phosphatase [Gemmatimonadota bacterium]